MPDHRTQTSANMLSGHTGLIAIDKLGNKVLFLDPVTYATVKVIDSFVPRVHELAISPDRTRAFVPIYGDGKHGDNPHPGHSIAVLDLLAQQHTGNFSTAPYLAPHGLRWGVEGQLYCLCEDSAVVLELDSQTGAMLAVIPVGSSNAHRMEVLPDGSKLYTENEEDGFVSVVDLNARRHVGNVAAPSALAGIALSPNGNTLVLVDAAQPRLFTLDTRTDTINTSIVLTGHQKPAQIARYSPNGDHLVVTSHDEPLATILAGDLSSQKTVTLGEGPMDMAFHENGRTVLIANHDASTISVVDLHAGETTSTFACGTGVETLSFY